MSEVRAMPETKPGPREGFDPYHLDPSHILEPPTSFGAIEHIRTLEAAVAEATQRISGIAASAASPTASRRSGQTLSRVSSGVCQ